MLSFRLLGLAPRVRCTAYVANRPHIRHAIIFASLPTPGGLMHTHPPISAWTHIPSQRIRNRYFNVQCLSTRTLSSWSRHVSLAQHPNTSARFPTAHNFTPRRLLICTKSSPRCAAGRHAQNSTLPWSRLSSLPGIRKFGHRTLSTSPLGPNDPARPHDLAHPYSAKDLYLTVQDMDKCVGGLILVREMYGDH